MRAYVMPDSEYYQMAYKYLPAVQRYHLVQNLNHLWPENYHYLLQPVASRNLLNL
jgi:hypothetical protein